MNTQPSASRRCGLGLLIVAALLAAGCGNSAQEKAYDHAAQMEQQFTVETAPTIIAEYRKVIAIEPGSNWATKSQTRIESMEARVKAEEQRKDVFQEHGID